jgi:aspartate aminotransferase
MDQGDEIIIPEPFMQITMFSTASVTVVPVISSIDTGFALPPIALKKINYCKNKSNTYCNPGTNGLFVFKRGNDATSSTCQKT